MKRYESYLYDRRSNPFGIPISEWTCIWWKWLHSIPKDRSPAFDNTGKFSDISQDNENVWFLAGTFGGTAVRNVFIPYGRALFFPILTSVFSFILDPQLKSEQALIRSVTQDIDSVEILSLTIDDKIFKDFSPFRIRSEPFEDTVDGIKSKMVSDGYWIFMKPLQIGIHKIHFMAKNINFFNQVTYNISITTSGPN